MPSPAQLVPLGRTDVRVTRLGIGCAPIGNMYSAVSDAQARGMLERAWELGLRFFDTAPLYGHGLSEARLGTMLRQRPRTELVLATKVGRLLVANDGGEEASIFVGLPPVHPVFDYSYDGTLRSFEQSLERLGLDRVDILHVHDPDDHAEEALGGAFPALRRLREEGVIGAVGAGMNQAEMLARFVREAGVDCVLLAGRYTLLDQIGLDELLPLCHARGVGVIVGGVFNSGLLASPQAGATYNYGPAPASLIERAQRLSALCAAHGVPLRAAALQFPTGHPAVASVLTGARSVEEIEENVGLFSLPIPSELWTALRRHGFLRAEAPIS